MKATPTPRALLAALLGLNNTLERRSESFFQPFGITGAQFNILNLLADAGVSLEQAAVVERLLVGKSSVSIVIQRMVRNGLIRRQEHRRDRRQTVLWLTPAGRERWERIFPIYEAGVNEIFRALKKGQGAFLLECLGTLDAALRQGEQAAPAPAAQKTSA